MFLSSKSLRNSPINSVRFVRFVNHPIKSQVLLRNCSWNRIIFWSNGAHFTCRRIFLYTASLTTIDRRISMFNYSFKRIHLIPEARNRYSMNESRFAYANFYLAQNEEKIIFLDECYTRSHYGRREVGTTTMKKLRTIRSKDYSVSSLKIIETCAIFIKTFAIIIRLSWKPCILVSTNIRMNKNNIK